MPVTIITILVLLLITHCTIKKCDGAKRSAISGTHHLSRNPSFTTTTQKTVEKNQRLVPLALTSRSNTVNDNWKIYDPRLLLQKPIRRGKTNLRRVKNSKTILMLKNQKKCFIRQCLSTPLEKKKNQQNVQPPLVSTKNNEKPLPTKNNKIAFNELPLISTWPKSFKKSMLLSPRDQSIPNIVSTAAIGKTRHFYCTNRDECYMTSAVHNQRKQPSLPLKIPLPYSLLS